MTNRITDIPQRQAAIVAGIGFLITLIGAVIATIYVENLIVPGDAAITANNIIASEGKFRVGIFGWLIAIFGDMVRAWALYVFFKQVNKSLALLAAWFMLVHDAILGSALVNLVLGSLLLSGADYLAVFEPNQLHSLVLLLANGFNSGFQIGLFFFSFHLCILGYLVYKSGFVPRILGILLIVASSGYLINSVGKLLSENFPEIIWTVFTLPMIIGESALILWLAFKGGKGSTVG